MAEVQFTRKDEALRALREVFAQWEALLADADDAAAASVLYGDRTLKDDVAHLWEWQRITVARLRAALDGTALDLGWLPAGLAADLDGEPHRINDHFYAANHERPWGDVSRDWRETFAAVIDLAAAVPEDALVEPGRYPWLGGYPLIAVLSGTVNHHQDEHLPTLRWLESR